jgi:hypothetical protein
MKMRRFFIVLSLGVFIFASMYVYPREKADAAFQWAVPLVALEVGAGAYALGAIAVAGAATVLGLEYGDEIYNHARSVWNGANQIVKDSVKSSVQAMVSAGKYVMNLSQDVKDYIYSKAGHLAASLIASYAKKTYEGGMSETEKTVSIGSPSAYYINTNTTVTTKYPGAYYEFSSGNKLTWYFPGFFIAFTSTLNDTFYYYDSITIRFNDDYPSLVVSIGSYTYHVATFSAPGMGIYEFKSFYINYLQQRLENVVGIINGSLTGYTSAVWLSTGAQIQDAQQKYDSIRQNIRDISNTSSIAVSVPKPTTIGTRGLDETGTKVQDIPPSTLVYNPVNDAYTFPDGTVYEGDVDWTFPMPQVGTGEGVGTITVPIDGVGQVDIFTGDVVAPAEGVPTVDGNPTRNPDTEANRWKQLVTTKFPFSLPWDLYAILSVLNAPPQKPVLRLDATGYIAGKVIPLKFSQNIDFLDPYMPFLRTFVLIGYVLFLIFSTRKLLGGGQ